MTDTDPLKQLAWELDQEKHAHWLLRERLGNLLKRLETKQEFADMCWRAVHMIGNRGSCTAEAGVFLAQAQVYSEQILALREAIGQHPQL